MLNPRVEDEVAESVKPIPGLTASISINGTTVAETVNDAGKAVLKNAANSVYSSLRFAVPVAISAEPVAAV